MFTDIIILGMDKQPTNLTVSVDNIFTSISNVDYSASTKVGNCFILLSCRALAESPGLRFWPLARPCSSEFGQSQRRLACWEIYCIAGRMQKKRECVTWTPALCSMRTLKRTVLSGGPCRKADLLWANLKLDMLIPDVI